MKINLNNYYLKNGEIWRKEHFCHKSNRMKYEKRMVPKKSGKYEYILIDGKYYAKKYIVELLKGNNE